MMTTCAVALGPDALDDDPVAAAADAGITVTMLPPHSAALLRHCREQRPDVVVSCIDLIDGPLVPVVPRLLQTAARLIVMSDDPSDPRVPDALLAGASGCVVGVALSSENLTRAICQVAAGDAVLHPAAADLVLRHWRVAQRPGATADVAARSLTKRESEVLQLAASGLTNASISTRLGVSVKTVESHKSRIFAKLGTSNQAAAITVAIRSGVLTATGIGR
jgi:DNA-binding NarL/FixJ family response regulator